MFIKNKNITENFLSIFLPTSYDGNQLFVIFKTKFFNTVLTLLLLRVHFVIIEGTLRKI